AADEHQEPALRVKVLLVDLHVLRQMADALGEERDLHLGGAGVSVGSTMFADRCGLVGHARVRAFSLKPGRRIRIRPRGLPDGTRPSPGQPAPSSSRARATSRCIWTTRSSTDSKRTWPRRW